MINIKGIFASYIVRKINLDLVFFNICSHFLKIRFHIEFFAVSDNTHINSNSGIKINADDIIANLGGHEEEYDALVFFCGDAMLDFGYNKDKSYNKAMLSIIKNFSDHNKIIIGHCAAALLFDTLDIAKDIMVTLHPFLEDIAKNYIVTDSPAVVDGNFHTAQTEEIIHTLMPDIIKALK